MDELHRCVEIFNLEFKLQLPKPVLGIERIRRTMGLFYIGRSGFGTMDTIVLNSYYTSDEFYQVLLTLLHEMLHQWQQYYGKPSSSPWHHNKEFQEKAKGCGLLVHPRGYLLGYRPDICNKDQGAQFTSEAFTGLLEQHRIRISMDGKGSYNDNLFIERLWRTVKYEEVYLKAYQDGRDARASLGDYFRFYNTERPHQALGYQTPAEVFNLMPVEVTNGGMVESLTSNTLRIAGPALNIAPILS